MSTLRLCLIQSNPVWGACEEYWSWLAEGLSTGQFKVTLVYPDCSALKEPFSQLSDCIEKLPQPIAYFQSIRSGLWPLYRQLRRLKPDIVHLNDPGLVSMIAATIAQIPSRVLTFHTPSQSFNYRPHARFLQRWVLHQNWQIIVIAPINKPTLKARYHLSDDEVHVIEYGLDPHKFEVADRRLAVRAEFQVPPDCVLLGCVARLAEQKNHALLLNAYATLPDDLLSQSRLLIVGDGPLRKALEQQVITLGLDRHVIFAGYRHDIPVLLNAMDIFVLASDYEGLPFAVLEAMAMGLPVIATAVDGIRDAIVPGQSGLTVPPRQVEALRDAIAQLIASSSQRQSFGQAARERFLQRYTLDRMIHETQNLYGQLVKATANV